MVRLQPDLTKQLDDWRRKQNDLPGRPEAIRRLIEIGLARPITSPKAPRVLATSAELATDVIDNSDAKDKPRGKGHTPAPACQRSFGISKR